MVKKYLMYPHAGSGNHGCEAIVRTTVALLGKDSTFTLFSDNPQEDQAYIPDRSFDLRQSQRSVRRFSRSYLRAFLRYHIGRQRDAFDAIAFSPVINMCSSETVLLSIGGDNYCYGDNDYIYLVNRYAKAKGCKTVLWGCSVEPDSISPDMAADLKSYDLIIARESITFHALKKINAKTLLFPDPAFTLPLQDTVLPNLLMGKRYIGINLSPLIQSKESIPGITFDNYKFLIQKLVEDTSYQIALIPHVVKEGNDDREAMKRLYDAVECPDRVVLVKDQNCMQLKSIISRCDFFIGARTHATIAAYSTCVPTLVVGYSVKARGIAKDLFGSTENYVLPVQALRSETDLYQSFLWIMHHQSEIRQQLNRSIPQYIKKAQELPNILNEVV